MVQVIERFEICYMVLITPCMQIYSNLDIKLYKELGNYMVTFSDDTSNQAEKCYIIV